MELIVAKSEECKITIILHSKFSISLKTVGRDSDSSFAGMINVKFFNFI